MVAFWSLLLPLAGLAGLINAKSSTGDSVLVVLEQSLPKEDYSIFFTSLTGVHVELQYYLLLTEKKNEVTISLSVRRRTSHLAS
jgi:hypothetical protein